MDANEVRFVRFGDVVDEEMVKAADALAAQGRLEEADAVVRFVKMWRAAGALGTGGDECPVED